MKKLLAILVACLMPICLIAGSGDVNGDGKVDKEDLSIIINVIMGRIPEGFDLTKADVSNDGDVNAADIVTVINEAERENTPNSLVLLAKSGQKVTYALADEPKISFTGTDLVINSKGIQKKYPMGNMARITYEKIADPATANIDEAAITGNTNEEYGAGKVFYVYRNDGDFNGFFYNQVEGISYSDISLDGKQKPYQVVQEISTADSLYRIPLVSVDSVGFVQPPAIMNSNVFTFTSDHSSYILQANTESFTLKKNTPANYQPQVGNVVVSKYDCLSFPDGIMAKVLSRTEQSDGIYYVCEHASIDDVYDQIVYYGYGDTYNTQNVEKSRALDVNLGLYSVLWDDIIDRTFNYDETSTNVNHHAVGTLEITIRKMSGKPLYARLTFDNDITSTYTLNASSERGFTPDPVKIGNTLVAGRIFIPECPAIWFEPQMSLYGYLELVGSIDLDLSAHYRRFDKFHIICKDKKWTFDHRTPIDEYGLDLASLSIKGYAEIGVQPEFMISINGTATGIGISTRIGLRETADFLKYDFLAENHDIYSYFKDSKTEESLTFSCSAFAQMGIFEGCLRGEYQIGFRKIPFGTHYILPLFSEINIEKDENSYSAAIKCSPSRDLLLPLKLGLGLYNEDGALIKAIYDQNDYQYENSDFTLHKAFGDLERGKKYTVKPLMRLFGKDIPATPTKEFELKNEIYVLSLFGSCIDENSAIIRGKVESFNPDSDEGEIGFFYNDKGFPSYGNGQKAVAGNLSTCKDGNFHSILTNLEENKTYYMCAYCYHNGNYIYGETVPFKTMEKEFYYSCPDNNHPHWIDLGLPSGTLWRCCNVGALTPEDFGGYFKYKTSPNIPTYEQWNEIASNQITNLNGVDGLLCTGKNGGTIFLPEAGYIAEDPSPGQWTDGWIGPRYRPGGGWYMISGSEVDLLFPYDRYLVWGYCPSDIDFAWGLISYRPVRMK